MQMKTTKELDNEYIAHTYARFPVEIVSGKGSIMVDDSGKEYIDMGTGIAVNIFGMADDEWVAAVEAQLHKFQHTSNLYYTAPCAQLAQILCARTGMKKVFFANSGAEANECAIKVARKYAAEKKGSDYYTIVTLINCFHGRTITTLAATGQDHYHEEFTPLTPGFVYAEANNLESVKKLVEENKVAAIMFEAVQGEGGVLPLTPEFAQGLAKIAEENDILLICDEVQTGNGRTGALYGYMNLGITPDVVTTAKGLGGGLPLGACMMGEKVKDTYQPGMHGSTFGGNPVCCAGAVNILNRIDDKLLAEVQEKSRYIVETLTGKSGIKSISGMGLMLGIQTEKKAGDIVAACREMGVLVLTAKDKVRLLPPLNIPMDTLKKAVAVIEKACAVE
ncbi:MAG: acetylornithine/succinylornithine family transaminase [Oscillospiraceae bacterium]|nr:acetylornithine/succinylornithine family transaminase [Oscillospiraceae bacterium]